MTRTEYVLKTAAIWFGGYIGFLSAHNLRQYGIEAKLLVPEFWIVQGQSAFAGAVAVSLWWSRSPRGQVETKQDEPGD